MLIFPHITKKGMGIYASFINTLMMYSNSALVSTKIKSWKGS